MLFECFNKAERHCPERPQLAFSGRCFRHRNPIRFFFFKRGFISRAPGLRSLCCSFPKQCKRVFPFENQLCAHVAIYTRWSGSPNSATTLGLRLARFENPFFPCVCVCARVTTRHPKLFIASPKSIFSFRFAISSITSSRAALI